VPLLLLLPGLLVVAALFVYPLTRSLVHAFHDEKLGVWGWGNFLHAWELYARDIFFTCGVVLLSTALIALLAIAIAGYLTLGENRRAVAVLRWLYRWPLFIPVVVAGQMMRTFLAKNGLMNNALMALDLIEPLQAISFLDWRGLVFTFVWKQLPFATLLLAGAMAALDGAQIEAARNLGAGRLRVLAQIIMPQVLPALLVSLILSFVAILSVLSVPMMINAGSPTMITVDMAWRVASYSDYGVANALGFISCAMCSLAAWFYLRQGLRDKGAA
jgi:ABC-type spermidine/putrescine transport system permease subunit I